MLDDIDSPLESGSYGTESPSSDESPGSSTATEGGYGYELTDDPLAAGGFGPTDGDDGSGGGEGSDDGKSTATEGGYGYELTDDPLSAGGFGVDGS